MTPALRRSPRTLAWRLLGAILPIVAVGVSAAVLVQYSLAKRQLLADINRQIRDRAARTAGAIDGLLRQRADELSTLRRLLGSATSGPSGAAYLETGQGRFPPAAGLDKTGSRVL